MNKFILISAVLFSAFTLAACDQADQAQLQPQIINTPNPNPTIIPQNIDTTDEQLLKQLDTNDTSVDADLKVLDSQLQ